jgi:hypothetical protein
METPTLFNKCMRELELTIAVFAEQKRPADFSEFRKRLKEASLSGKGRPILDIILELRMYVDALNIKYIENMKNPPCSLSINEKKFFDLYMNLCSGRQDNISYEPTSEELEYLNMIKTVEENNIKFASELEISIFQMIARKNNKNVV